MTIEAGVLAPLALASWLYARGTRHAWRRAGVGRGVPVRRAACFGLGIATLAFALVGPLDHLAEELFSGHMAQHMLLMNVAAPLLVLGEPLQAMIRALPPALRSALAHAVHRPAWRAGWSWLTGAVVATIAQQAVLWSWHLPGAVAAALGDRAIHAAMHASLLAAALLFWTVVFARGRHARWRAVAALTATFKAMGIVCILLLLVDRSFYPVYGAGAPHFGLTPVEDEHLGWGLMMLMGGTQYLAVAAWLLLTELDYSNGPTPSRPAPCSRSSPPPSPAAFPNPPG